MNATILGCGLIGANWAALFAAIGRHRVSAWDPSATARGAFADKVARAEGQLIELGAQAGEPVAVFEHLDEAVKFFGDVGRVPVCMRKEATGHIGNRLASALWREHPTIDE